MLYVHTGRVKARPEAQSKLSVHFLIHWYFCLACTFNSNGYLPFHFHSTNFCHGSRLESASNLSQQNLFSSPLPGILFFLIILIHIRPSLLKPTLDIKPLILHVTAQNTLIAPDILRHRAQRLNHLQPQLLALFLLPNGNLFNMRYTTEIMNARIIVSKCFEVVKKTRRTTSSPPSTSPSQQSAPHAR